MTMMDLPLLPTIEEGLRGMYTKKAEARIVKLSCCRGHSLQGEDIPLLGRRNSTMD